jgi:hypothetical protein
MSRLVVQAADVYGEPLHQEGSSSADRVSTMLNEFFQEFLVTEERIG